MRSRADLIPDTGLPIHGYLTLNLPFNLALILAPGD